MDVKVVDASAIGAVLFNEPDADKIISRMQNCQLVAPVLLQFEAASICLKKIKKHPELRERLMAAHGLFYKMEMSYPAIEMTEVIGLSEKTGLSTYDASYLWLAQSLEAELITLDKELEKAYRP